MFDPPKTVTLVTEAPRKPWEQRRRESAAAFTAFQCFLRLPRDKRSIAAAATAGGRGYDATKRIANRWDWLDRARAWDRDEDNQLARMERVEKEKIVRRHAQIATQHIAVLLAPVVELGKRMQAQAVDLSKVKDPELIKMVQRSAPAIRTLVDVERLSSGLPSSAAMIEGPDGGPVRMTVLDAVRDVFGRPPDADEDG